MYIAFDHILTRRIVFGDQCICICICLCLCLWWWSRAGQNICVFVFVFVFVFDDHPGQGRTSVSLSLSLYLSLMIIQGRAEHLSTSLLSHSPLRKEPTILTPALPMLCFIRCQEMFLKFIWKDHNCHISTVHHVTTSVTVNLWQMDALRQNLLSIILQIPLLESFPLHHHPHHSQDYQHPVTWVVSKRSQHARRMVTTWNER